MDTEWIHLSLVPRKFHYMLGARSPSDKVEISANWGDLPQISAKTATPMQFPLEDYNYKLYRDPLSLRHNIHIDIKFRDPAGERHSYVRLKLYTFTQEFLQLPKDLQCHGEQHSFRIRSSPHRSDQKQCSRRLRTARCLPSHTHRMCRQGLAARMS